MSQPNPNMTYEELQEQVRKIITEAMHTATAPQFGSSYQPYSTDELIDQNIQLFATLCTEMTIMLPPKRDHPSTSDPNEAEKIIGYLDTGWNEYRKYAKEAIAAYLAQLTTKNTEEENV